MGGSAAACLSRGAAAMAVHYLHLWPRPVPEPPVTGTPSYWKPQDDEKRRMQTRNPQSHGENEASPWSWGDRLDPGADEDGELTYENVQVPAVPGGPSSLASSVLGDKAAVKSEQPTASWRAVTSPAVGRILPCRTACLRYLLLGLFLTCLLLGVAAICLGVRYTCCPLGWIMHQKSCFYISFTSKNWQESQKQCETLSSKLATFSEISQQSHSYYFLNSLLPNGGSGNSYWTGLSSNKDWKLTDDTQHTRTYTQSSKCTKVHKTWSWTWMAESEACRNSLPYICEMTAFRFPD
ncbi:B-cell differentiation antigen CD72 isoform X4 [Pongo pygmaeus]|uniref:B-cell differentiation antigen CD72 isoform X4 n=1 Tax=Pongo pygmaeus TaxID=9600 RepID=UPI0023E17514|nr:B-cell differentiation antigen CD72 isoform X4 [Pongo pygmaeus]